MLATILAIVFMAYLFARIFMGKEANGYFRSAFASFWNFIWRTTWRTVTGIFHYLAHILKKLLLYLGMFLWKFFQWLVWFVYELARFLWHALGKFFRSLADG